MIQASSALNVAVTGTGCVSAAGFTPGQYWQALVSHRAGCVPVPSWLFKTTLPYPVFVTGEEPLGPGERHLLEESGMDIGRLSRTTRLAAKASISALEEAGISMDHLRGVRLGIFLGTTVGCTFNDDHYYLEWSRGERPPLDPVAAYLESNLSWALHCLLGTRGPALVVTNACSSGTDAIGMACKWLRQDRCDIALAGGADELSRIAYNGFSALMLTSEAPCRPFDPDRTGLNLGEGAGIMLLEPMERALRRDAGIQGRILGYGSASDAYHPTAPHPRGEGLKTAFEQALEQAGIDKSDLAYVNCHGTGTRANDLAEARFLLDYFGTHGPPCVSTKGVTGHTLGAAGGVEAIFTLMALRKGETPGTTGCALGDPGLEEAKRPNILPQEEDARLNGTVGASQSLAFGGTNAVLIMEAL